MEGEITNSSSNNNNFEYLSYEKGARGTLQKKLICSLKGRFLQLSLTIRPVGLYIKEGGEGKEAHKW